MGESGAKGCFWLMGEGAYPSTLARRTELRRETAAEVRSQPRVAVTEYSPSLLDRLPPLRDPLLRGGPWLIPLIVGITALRLLDVPFGTILAYLAYYTLCLVLPGVLLLRAVCGSTGTWPEDVGLGAAIGFAFELVGWALFTSVGQQEYLVAWPAMVLVVFVTARPLHRYWRIGRPPRVPVVWHWGLALAAALTIAFGTYYGLDGTGVPPFSNSYNQDLLYHLSLVQEAMRSVPPELPQVAGERLNYHWFANAHMAASADITGISPELVLFRMWMLPMCVVSVLLFAGLARQVSRVWWTGVVAAALLACGQYVDLWPIPAGMGTSTMSLFSPSLQYGSVLAVGAAMLMIEQVYRGPAPLRSWILTVPLLIAAGGAKPTGLPLLLGGIGFAGLYHLCRRFRIPWKGLFAGVLVTSFMLITLATVVGSTAGSKIRVFGILRGLPGYIEITGDTSMRSGLGWIVPAMSVGGTFAYWGAMVVLASLLVSQLFSFGVFAALGHRGTRSDPLAWWLVGTVIAGWAGGLLLDHPSSSEVYFPRSAIPFATVGAVWVLASALRGRSRRTAAITGVAGLLLGIVLIVIVQQVRPDPTGSPQHRLDALGTPMAWLAGICLALIALWMGLRFRLRVVRGLGVAVAMLALIGMTLPSTWAYARSAARSWPTAEANRADAAEVHPDEQRAALWLRDHSRPDDVVATNTACRPARRQPPCDARGYIVSGIAGRRTVLEGWAYTQQALGQQGVNGLSYHYQPSPWPDRAGMMNRLFTSPTRDLVEFLRTRYGVRWIYADQLAGPVAVKTLGKLAILRHSEPSVQIFEVVPQDALPMDETPQPPENRTSIGEPARLGEVQGSS